MQELVEHKAAALAAEAERSMARGDVQAADLASKSDPDK